MVVQVFTSYGDALLKVPCMHLQSRCAIDGVTPQAASGLPTAISVLLCSVLTRGSLRISRRIKYFFVACSRAEAVEFSLYLVH